MGGMNLNTQVKMEIFLNVLEGETLLVGEFASEEKKKERTGKR